MIYLSYFPEWRVQMYDTRKWYLRRTTYYCYLVEGTTKWLIVPRIIWTYFWKEVWIFNKHNRQLTGLYSFVSESLLNTEALRIRYFKDIYENGNGVWMWLAMILVQLFETRRELPKTCVIEKLKAELISYVSTYIRLSYYVICSAT